MKQFSLKLCLFLTLFLGACRSISVIKVSRLPEKLIESSGLVVESPHAFWSHNDGGGDPAVYKFDEKGVLLQTIKIANATNIDWEEMQLDEKGNLYIGDIGNNAQMRRDLCFYKIKDFKNENKNEIVEAERIFFYYEDQTSFPPSDAEKRFDSEAFLPIGDSIFIFTKDFYTNPYAGKTWIYTIPNQVGKHKAKLIYVFETDKTSRQKGSITGVAITPNRDKIALMSYQKLWIFSIKSNFPPFSLEKPVKTFRFGFSQFAQREAVAFLDSCQLYMTSERIKNVLGGNLSSTKVCKTLKKTEFQD